MNAALHKILLERILFMEYEPGQILNEKVLAKEFGISRTPLREVLNRLEWEQLARILPRTGTMVTEIEYQKMMNVYQIRLELEALAGKLAAENITVRHTERLEAIRSDCAALLDRADGDVDKRSLVDVDLRFRAVLYDAAGNEVLVHISNYLYHLTLRLWYVTIDKKNWAEEVSALLEEIRRSLDILEEGGARKMEELRRASLISHLERIRVKFLGLR